MGVIIPKWQNIERVKVVGSANTRRQSPSFRLAPAITASSRYEIDIERTAPYAKYVPFNSLNIINKSSANASVYINDTNREFVPINAVINLTEQEYPAIRTLYITNDDAANNITAGELVLQLQKKTTFQGLSDTLARRFLI